MKLAEPRALTRDQIAFARGFYHGQSDGETSPREAALAIPDYQEHSELDAFCQGTVDGAQGDSCRLDLILKQSAERREVIQARRDSAPTAGV